MNRKPKDKRSKKKDFDPYLFGAPRGVLGATPKGKLEKDLRVPINSELAKMYKNAPRGMERGGSVETKGFNYKIPNPNEVLLLKKMVTPSGKVVDVSKNKPVKMKYGGAVMKGRGGSYKGCK